MTSSVMTVSVIVQAPIEIVWAAWTQPQHIIAWNFASQDWACPEAKNDLRVGGVFTYVMAAKDGAEQFEFSGTYTNVQVNQQLEYTLFDGRNVQVHFEIISSHEIKIVESFEMESVNSEELQRAGWQAILMNFKKHAESLH